MNRQGVVLLAFGIAAGAVGGYWYAGQPARLGSAAPQSAAAAERRIIYYRDPSGAPYWSAAPKKDAGGRDYLPVYDDQEVSFGAAKNPPAAAGPRRVLYYRNPMGLPDTSPVPKKDWMGMDYIPVYEGKEQDDANIFRVSLDKIQRSAAWAARTRIRTSKARCSGSAISGFRRAGSGKSARPAATRVRSTGRLRLPAM